MYNKPAKMTSPSLWSYDQKIEREEKISKTLFINSLEGKGVMVFNATFNNISVMSWRCFQKFGNDQLAN